MDWSKIKTAVETLAPMIASALGTPVAGTAVLALEQVFGLTPQPNSTIETRQNDLAAAIAGASPDQLLAMKKADQDYAVQMATLGFKNAEALAALNVQDRESARDLQVKTGSRTAPTLAGFITLGFFGTLAIMMFMNLPASTHDALMLMLGSLGTSWTGVVAYYFGSSAGSDRKTELMANAKQ